MGVRKASLSTTIGLGLFVLALAPILVLAVAGGRLVDLNMERTMETSLMVEARLAAKEAAWGRASVVMVLDSMGLFPSGKNPELASFLSKGGGRRIRVEFVARIDPEGRPALLWPPEKAVSVANALSGLPLSNLEEDDSSPEAASWSGPYPDGRGGSLLVGSRRGSWGGRPRSPQHRHAQGTIYRPSASPRPIAWPSSMVKAGSSREASPQPSPREAWTPGSSNRGGTGPGSAPGAGPSSPTRSPCPTAPGWPSIIGMGAFLSPFYSDLALRLGGAAVAAVILALFLGLRIRRAMAARP